jgi:hypothetical protein
VVDIVVSPGSSTADFQVALSYLQGSPAFRDRYQVLVNSDRHYTVNVNSSVPDRYMPDERTIYFDPHEGLQFSNGDVQSPAIGFAHEVSHASRHEEDPKQWAADRKVTSKITDHEIVLTRKGTDEAKATKFERQVASDLKERGRKTYEEPTKRVRVDSPTTHSVDHCAIGASCHSGTDIEFWN